MVKGVNIRRNRFLSQFCLLALRPCTGYLTFLALIILIFTLETFQLAINILFYNFHELFDVAPLKWKSEKLFYLHFFFLFGPGLGFGGERWRSEFFPSILLN